MKLKNYAKLLVALGVMGNLTSGATLAGYSQAQPTTALKRAAYGKLPLSFEANHGQTDKQVKFLSRGSGYSLFLTSTEAVLALNKPSFDTRPKFGTVHATTKQSHTVLRMKLLGAKPAPVVTGLNQLPGKINYFQAKDTQKLHKVNYLAGKDAQQWRRNVSIPTYAKVHYKAVYPGVDIVYYGNQRQLEYDFIVAPGADPSAIKLAFEGMKKMHVDARGDLVLETADGEIRQHKPVIYQEVNGKKQEIAGRYVVQDKSQVGFNVAAYDPSKPLVIDPVLSYSTYLGGTGGDYAYGIAVDKAGNAYVTGLTGSPNFPTKNPADSRASVLDAFVTKLNSTGSALIYSTYLGTEGDDSGNDIVVDTAGNAYVTGYITRNGDRDVLALKLDPTGSKLLYTVFFGGVFKYSLGSDSGNAIAVDSKGNAYVTGDTDAQDFPTTQGALQTKYGSLQDAFVTKLNTTGKIVYSTFLGGGGYDGGYGIAVDAAGNAYVTGRGSGSVTGRQFPITANAFQKASDSSGNVFVTKLNPTGSALVYSTFLGGTGGDSGYGIAVDSKGNAYVTGYANSSNFPTTAGAFQTQKKYLSSSGLTCLSVPIDFLGAPLASCEDVFVTKLNPTGSSLIYSTLVGGPWTDIGSDIATDSTGNAYVTGRTFMGEFRIVNAVQSAPGGGRTDAFVTKLNPTGSALVYSTYLGGRGDDESNDIAVDSKGNAYVVGTTSSSTAQNNFPTTNRAFQRTFGGGTLSPNSDAFVTKIAPR